MNGEIDAAGGERFLNLLGEHTLRANLGEGHFLQAVAGGFDDFDVDFVALDAEQLSNVIGLPQSELRTATANAELHRRASVAGWWNGCID
jgi:hypothetical protein